MGPVGWIVASGGVLLVWAGIANPPGGAWGELGRVLRGEATSRLRATPAGWTTAPVSLPGGAGSTVPAGSTPTPTPSTPGAPAAGAAAVVLAEARRHIGKPYRWGGNGPDAFDCSGLTVAAFRAAGVSLPRTAATQQLRGRAVAGGLPNAAPGDLIFYGMPAWHVAIYAGGSRMVEAPRTGLHVREVPVWGVPTSVRRVLPAASAPALIPA